MTYFATLKTVDGKRLRTFCLSAGQLWFLSSDNYYSASLMDAGTWMTETLRENLCLLDCDSNPLNSEFAVWLLLIGKGAHQDKDAIRVSLKKVNNISHPSEERSISKVKKSVNEDINNIISQNRPWDSCQYFKERGIISPLNANITKINTSLPSSAPGLKHNSTSFDKMAEDSPQAVSEEVLKSINPPGFPGHFLELKKGIPVMLICNLNVAKGLVNGTCMLVQNIKWHVLKCLIMTGARKGIQDLIPKITLNLEDDEELRSNFTRYELSVNVAFAITINNSQGQPLAIVGVYLQTHVFAHGQLYVTLLRT
ncbi:hypothetical protein O181_082011 [Austropuccinia psidii MF-1]|uniref:DNA helicase Pif1-like 2B domain-containing protein n=1 Tax=Austropuccinia psidii MF-1 TaxID=1389203 RepID=A0A9Q3FLA9_9BASI|nr:hypothetical protein [Austropuccinia psidii MF-1]